MTLPIIMFDMDGTLLDLAFDDLIWNQQLPIRHAQTHQCTLEQSQKILGSFYQQHKHTLAWYSSKYWTEKVGVDVLQLQYDHCDRVNTRPGCIELLQQLQAQGYRCWLVTNADVASLTFKLKLMKIKDYFEVIVSSEQLAHAKEEQAFWQLLQQQHPFNPNEVVFVDDTAPVLDAAQKFGLQHLVTIIQPSSIQKPRDAAELNYPSIQVLTELLPYLSKINLSPSSMKEANVKTA